MNIFLSLKGSLLVLFSLVVAAVYKMIEKGSVLIEINLCGVGNDLIMYNKD